jgi:hypothetical protein
MNFLVIVGLLPIVLVALFHRLLTLGRKKNDKVKGQLPGPKSYTFFGNLDIINYRNGNGVYKNNINMI